MPSKRSLPNIEAIARIAGVSKSTVSRALNNSSLISDETRLRIRAIAEQHNFQINAQARQLSTRRSNTIAFVTHPAAAEFSLADLFSLEIMGGISRGLSDAGYDMLVIHMEPKDTSWVSRYLDSGRVDGFILMTSVRKQDHVRALSQLGAPFISWGAPPPGQSYCSVTGDNYAGGRIATEHLIDRGRRRIGFLGAAADELEVRGRLDGYLDALRHAGLEPVPERIVHANYWHGEDVRLALPALLAQAPDLDAIVTVSDLMAMTALDLLRESGRLVPQDVALVGFDDLSIARYSNPPLTTVRQNIPMAGRVLAQNLIHYLATGIVSNVTLPVELCVRASS